MIELSETAKMGVLAATQSFDATYEGFTFDDFMRTVSTLTAWNAQGRAGPQSDDNRVKGMIDEGYSATRSHIDQIRNEIEVHRLELLAER